MLRKLRKVRRIVDMAVGGAVFEQCLVVFVLGSRD